MAPSLTESLPQAPHTLRKSSRAPTDIFPDGYKTTGQIPPIYEQLQPYEVFPQEIAGSTVWKKEDYESNPERWTHVFNDDEVEELSKAADDFMASPTPLTGISKV